MLKALENSIFLLICAGVLIGLNFPLGKIASDASISPILWPLMISVGGILAIVPLLAVKGQLTRPSFKVLRFSLISGLISFVAANILVFTVIPHVGSGYAGLMFATSPVFTLALSIAFRFKPPIRLGILGIGVGFVGACIVALSRQSIVETGNTFWLIAAFFIPITLAIGNIYRTIGWPENASPDVLALWSNVFASLAYILMLLVLYQDLRLTQLSAAPLATALQLIIGGLTFPIYFRLQKYGGPVLLSQLGYIAAAVGLIAATAFLGERYEFLTWLGAGVILVGIVFTIRAQQVLNQNPSP